MNSKLITNIKFGAAGRNSMKDDLTKDTALKTIAEITSVDTEAMDCLVKQEPMESWELSINSVVVFHYQTAPYKNFYITIDTDTSELIFEEKKHFNTKEEFKKCCSTWLNEALLKNRIGDEN